jgi:hypothetical protein
MDCILRREAADICRKNVSKIGNFFGQFWWENPNKKKPKKGFQKLEKEYEGEYSSYNTEIWVEFGE